MHKFKLAFLTLGGAVVCTLCLQLTALAGSNGRQDNIKSKGVLNVSNESNSVTLDSSDLTSLAREIDSLENAYKTTAVQSLEAVGQSVGSSDWSSICSAIQHSQDVSDPATADSLSLGKQAWVQGQLITGTGANETTAYNKGNDDGYEKGYDDAYSSLPDLSVYFGMYGSGDTNNFSYTKLIMTVPPGYKKLTLYYDTDAWRGWIQGCGLNVAED